MPVLTVADGGTAPDRTATAAAERAAQHSDERVVLHAVPEDAAREDGRRTEGRGSAGRSLPPGTDRPVVTPMRREA